MPDPFSAVRFAGSAFSLSQLPPDRGTEVAFCGRSNTGKSSAINAITGRRRLARISKTPGCTTAINLYALDGTCRLVDLPGFGYARVSQALQRRWAKTLNRYLQHRRCLRGLVLVVDIRRALAAVDEEVLTWCRDAAMPVLVLLAKADKLPFGKRVQALKTIRQGLARLHPQASVQLFSAMDGEGVLAARAHLASWLQPTLKKKPRKIGERARGLTSPET